MMRMTARQRRGFFAKLRRGIIKSNRPRWIVRKKGSKYKTLNTTGRKRVVGRRNITDKEASKERRAGRVKGYVNNPDKFRKSGIIRKNYKRRSRGFF
tara:strand:+ start:2233 stop:2523 length:291 start_codon:yes stop_codon:yes gene_type:complete